MAPELRLNPRRYAGSACEANLQSPGSSKTDFYTSDDVNCLTSRNSELVGL